MRQIIRPQLGDEAVSGRRDDEVRHLVLLIAGYGYLGGCQHAIFCK